MLGASSNWFLKVIPTQKHLVGRRLLLHPATTRIKAFLSRRARKDQEIGAAAKQARLERGRTPLVFLHQSRWRCRDPQCSNGFVANPETQGTLPPPNHKR